ncbi:MAG TPA: FAD-dependent oxidoreductase [Chloroflexi bacterium]|nr:FAD-dependent oxidoreductase [Chloroflexota bacterium]
MLQRFTTEAPVIDEVDVLVCGGGPAGIGAAIAAGREGASVMLIEQQGQLGGVATGALVGVWLGSYSRDGAYPVVGGIFSEIVHRLVSEGAAKPAAEDVVGGSRHVGYAPWHGRVVPFEFEPCKRVCEQMALEAGARIRYFTQVVRPKEEDGHLQGVFVHSKSGMEFISAKVVVDATGDADVAFRAGCPVMKGREEDGLMSPVTTVLVVEEVDSAAFESYCRKTDDYRFRKLISELKEKEEWPFVFEIIICCEMARRGRFCVNTLRQTGIDGTNADDLTRGMIEGRAQAATLLDLMRRYVPGFARARLVQTSSVLGVRDTRRIIGDYVITVADVTEGRHYPDTIALSGYGWDMADPKRPSHQCMWGKPMRLPYVEIPYRSLLPQGVGNLLVGGRCVSAEWDALGPVRIMPACFAMGQAAGTAAAMAAQCGITMRDVSVSALRERLVAQGAILTPDGGSIRPVSRVAR